jgi:hypothetical protein
MAKDVLFVCGQKCILVVELVAAMYGFEASTSVIMQAYLVQNSLQNFEEPLDLGTTVASKLSAQSPSAASILDQSLHGKFLPKFR